MGEPSWSILVQSPCSRRATALALRASAFWLAAPAGAFAQLVEARETLAELRFEGVDRGLVEGRAGERLGQAVDSADAFLGIGRVDVALSVADILHQPGRCVAD